MRGRRGKVEAEGESGFVVLKFFAEFEESPGVRVDSWNCEKKKKKNVSGGKSVTNSP